MPVRYAGGPPLRLAWILEHPGPKGLPVKWRAKKLGVMLLHFLILLCRGGLILKDLS